MTRCRSPLLLVALLLTLGTPGDIIAQTTTPASPTVVLDTAGSWRMHHTLRPPDVGDAGGTKPLALGQQWLNAPTPEPPQGWATGEFDDGAWTRGPLGTVCRTPFLARLCLRGKFRVTDPAKVGKLTLTLGYHGGVIVSLNGKEIARQHVAAGPLTAKTLAEAYAPDAFVDANGELLVESGGLVKKGQRKGRLSADENRRTALRHRSITVPVAPSDLRKGINVLAVEIVRAPYDKAVTDQAGKNRSRNIFPYQLRWDTCDVRGLRLVADSPEGLQSNVTRAKGLHLWNSDPNASDFSVDFGDPLETLQPVEIVGARNGRFTGKIVLGSTSAVRGLTVTPSDLKGAAGATISASAVEIRYGLPWGSQSGNGGRPAYPAQLLGCLAPRPLKEFPVHPATRPRGSVSPAPVPGAVVPLWITIAVPAEAKDGLYTGRITIGADGETSREATVRLTVADWTLPDTNAYRTWVDLIQCPDTPALEYGETLWSERHWQLIERSLKLMGEAGVRIAYVPLICHTNIGNAESMVRWVDRGDNEYQYDFTVMDRYLDLVEKHMGKPQIVCLNVWDVYMIPKEDTLTDAEARRQGKSKGHSRIAVNLARLGAKYGTGPLVTVVDPKTGETENVYLPPIKQPESRALWKPLVDQLLARLEKRGLKKSVMLGMNMDAHASAEEVRFFADLMGNPPWVFQGHYGFGGGKKLFRGVARCGYETRVWTVGFPDNVSRHNVNIGEKAVYGWKAEHLFANFERNTGLDVFPPLRWRQFCESNIVGLQRGVGRVGADVWPVVKDRRGRRRGRAHERYPESNWRNLNLTTSVLCPGPEGPCATNRFEAFRLGLQESEARIAVERALSDPAARKRLGAELVARAEDVLAERMAAMWKSLSNLQLRDNSTATAWRWNPGLAGQTWWLGSQWQERTKTLFDLAGDVERKLGR